MRAILGIDAAWTEKNPSGVALVVETSKGWHLKTVAACYQHFDPFEGQASLRTPVGSRPDIPSLLKAACAYCDGAPDIVAVDIPVARGDIVGRRPSDDAVSRAYGARQCGTHTPNKTRPGPISVAIQRGFQEAGYPLCTETVVTPGLIEVYPHPALVELAQASKRLPYKVDKVRSYWRDCTREERRKRLLAEWQQIVRLLDREIDGVANSLPELQPGAKKAELKAYEDKLDAVVCAWVGILAVTGKARPYGDDSSAIWIPTPAGLAP